MPMDRSLYPDDWEAISFAVKTEADWTCQLCDRPCRLPGEELTDFMLRVNKIASFDLDELRNHPQRFCLAVAHLDQNPANNDRSNLKALCTGCHLNHDRPFQKMNGMAKLERRGQLNLLAEVRDASA